VIALLDGLWDWEGEPLSENFVRGDLLFLASFAALR